MTKLSNLRLKETEITGINNYYPEKKKIKNIVLGQDLLSEFVKYIDRSEKTTRSYLTNLRQFYKYLHDNGITQPDREDIYGFRNYIASYCSGNTTSQYIRTVKQFFEWTELSGYYPNISRNIHTPAVHKAEHKKDAFTPEDIQKIEKSIDRSDEKGKRLFAMFQLTVAAGLRTIEINRANIGDFQEKNGRYILYIYGKGHTGADQKKYLPAAVGESIKEYLKARTDKKTEKAPLFVSTDRATHGGRIATTTISTIFKRAMQKAGYDSRRLTAHSLRHTTGTALLNMTGDLYTTQKYMRHVNPQTTEIYIHEQETEKENGTAERLYNYLHGIEDEKSGTLADLEQLTPSELKKLLSVVKALNTIEA